jgi:CubicO group peptidase (beta-lactamase class C family)
MVKPFIFLPLKRYVEEFEAYLGKDASEHQSKWRSLRDRGYRFISLSVFGDPNQYAAVLVKRDGPQWEHTTGSISSLHNHIAAYRNNGFAPTIISITGEADSATYAIVWEYGAFPEGWIVSPFELDSKQDFFAQCDWARENGYYLVSPTMYGSEINDVKYAAIWARYSNTQPIRWNFHVTDDENESKRWTAAVPLNRYRISHLAVTTFPLPTRRYLSVFRDDNAGQDLRWWALTPSEDPSLKGREGWSKQIAYNVSEGQYEALRDNIKKSGFYPTCIQGSVIGPNNPPPQYTVIFGRSDRPYDRQWTVTGTNQYPQYPQYQILKPSSLTDIDEIIQHFMQHDGIRAGVLAIAENGVIKLLHGYTWAESGAGYPITYPDSLFRIASVSKMFTCAAIQKLYDDKLLYPNTKVFPKLEISSPAIEGQHLVDHLGGWLRDVPNLGDPVFAIRSIALSLKLPKQLTKMDFARFMYGQPLQFDPGKQPAGVDTYSNFGYVLLGMLVEKASKQNFIDFVREKVLAQIDITDPYTEVTGIHDVFLARTLPSQTAINEVLYDDPGLGPSAVDWPGRSYASDDLVPHPHGGEGFSTEIMDSGGGLMSTAKALVQFASRYPVWGVGKGRSPGYGRNGSMAGTNSFVKSREDGFDYAYIFNTRNEIPGPGRINLDFQINDFLDKMSVPRD